MKFSIRLSILSIVLILLIGVSVLILSITYFALNNVLVSAASFSLTHVSGKVSQQVKSYLEPLNSDIAIASGMIEAGLIKPENSNRFFKLLHGLVAYDFGLVSAYWGGADGNVYDVSKLGVDGSYYQIAMLRSKAGNKTIKTKFDAHGKKLDTIVSPFVDLDPRTRPWYKKAKQYKQPIWSGYRFIAVGGQKQQMGITSALPVYGSDGKLLGVFGVDMPLSGVYNYIHNIRITENSAIFIVDDVGDVLAIHAPKSKSEVMLNVDDLNMPWLKKSFTFHNKNHKTPFIYSYNNKKYISSYEKIADIKDEYTWFVAIVMPIDDIISPLQKGALVTLIFISFSLLFGIILASIFSLSLSRPIKKLAKDADLICKLRLSEVKGITSWIIEISEMDKSFMKMKNALSSFQLYMPITLVKKLVASNNVATVGGESKELTLLFTNVQDFSKLSENITPEEIMHYLSRYFQVITKIIIETNGTVDKYIGDGVMAFWGAPVDDSKHAIHACQAVLQIQNVLHELNEEWRAENKPITVTHIGINTGDVVVGNVGSDDRLNYTALGDPVNLASRLEGLNKVYGTSVIVSEFTYNKVKNNFKFRLLDKVAAKGKKQSAYIYELLGAVTLIPDIELEKYNREFIDAFSQYERGNWQVAVELFKALNKKHPGDQLIKIFIERCEAFIVNPPTDWDGAWIMTEK